MSMLPAHSQQLISQIEHVIRLAKLIKQSVQGLEIEMIRRDCFLSDSLDDLINILKKIIS